MAAVVAYMGQQDYKKNTDVKIQAAVNDAVAKTQIAKDNEYAEKDKLPLREYAGPSAYGSILVKYPKSWSAYVNEGGGGNNIVMDGYFHPVFVPAAAKSTYAFRLQVINTSYDNYSKQHDKNIKDGKLVASAYRLPLVASELGLKFDGEIAKDKKGTLVAVKLRDKTLVLWAETDQFKKDFEEIILPNLSFVP